MERSASSTTLPTRERLPSNEIERCEREIVTRPDREQLLSLVACTRNGPHQIRAERLKVRLHADAGTTVTVGTPLISVTAPLPLFQSELATT